MPRRRFAGFLVLAGLLLAAAAAAPAAGPEQAPAPVFTIHARLLTDLGYNGQSQELTSNRREAVTTAYASLAANSYLRAKFMSPDHSAGGLLELGLGSRLGDNEAALLRYAYGWFQHGPWRVVAGQDESWVGGLKHAPKQNLGTSQSGKLYLSDWGFLYSGRHSMVRLEWGQGAWGACLGLVQPMAELTPSASGGLTTGSAALPAGVDLYADLPRVDLALDLRAGGLWLGPGAGWARYRLEGAGAGEDSITTWVAVLPFKLTLGPLTAKGEVHHGQNTDYEWSGDILTGLRGLPRAVAFLAADGKLSDTRQTGGFLTLEWKFAPKWELIGGYGVERLANDAWKDQAGYAQDSYTRQAFFAALPCQVTANFTIHPEFGYYDYGDRVQDGKAFGNEWLAGIQFRWIF
ncbi:MAG: hypothetical protein V1797_09065 [Pseudomonadota bacterium]